MVKNTFWTVKKVTIGVGIGRRFGFGIMLDAWSFNIDFGPFWLFIEW